MFICKICEKKQNTKKSLSNHLVKHNYRILEYFIEYENFDLPLCECGNACKLRKGLIFSKTCCKTECKLNLMRKKIHTDESKKLISKKRKEWLRQNPDKHPWKKNDKFKSKPCELLKSIFKDNFLDFQSELQPLEDRFYSIDIAFIDKGIGIEINGNQHYNSNGELNYYYKIRKEMIESKGWKLLDIHYSKVYDNIFINDLINFIKGSDKKIDLKFSFNKTNNKSCDCGKKIYKYSKTGICSVCSSLNKRKVFRPSKDILLKDIEELGYSGTGRKYGVSDNSIRKWIR